MNLLNLIQCNDSGAVTSIMPLLLKSDTAASTCECVSACVRAGTNVSCNVARRLDRGVFLLGTTELATS